MDGERPDPRLAQAPFRSGWGIGGPWLSHPAGALLDVHTAVGGVPGTGWDLHEYRHSGLTHLGEAGASLPMPMAKSRHRKPENVRRYFHPSAEAIAEVTSLLAPGTAGADGGLGGPRGSAHHTP